MFYNRVLRRICGHKRDDVKREWRKLRNELNDLYFSPNIIWVMKSRGIMWAVHVERIRERSGVYRFLVGKPEQKGPIGRPSHKLEDNIKMELEV